MEKPFFFMAGEILDNAAKYSTAAKTISRIKHFKDKSVFLKPKQKTKKKSFFDYNELNTNSIFWNSRIAKPVLEIARFLYDWIESKALFPQWFLQKIVKKKYLIGALLAIVTMANAITRIAIGQFSAQDFSATAMMLALGALLALIGFYLEKHAKKSFLLRKALHFWNETKI